MKLMNFEEQQYMGTPAVERKQKGKTVAIAEIIIIDAHRAVIR
jgi:hypothetical protein